MRLCALVAGVLLAGCAAVPPGSGEAETLSAIVGETVVASRAPALEQRRLLEQAERRHAEQPGKPSGLRLAALLVSLPEPMRDDARARALLEPLAAKDPDTPLARFAALLSHQAVERQRWRREFELTRRAGQQREDALRQQIEALKEIERGMLEREERLRAKRR
jgi:hypothetical protein